MAGHGHVGRGMGKWARAAKNKEREVVRGEEESVRERVRLLVLKLNLATSIGQSAKYKALLNPSKAKLDAGKANNVLTISQGT